MIEVRLAYEGAGRFAVANHLDFRTLADEACQGEQFIARLVRPRSVNENNLFHGSIELAWHNQRGGPFFSDEEGGWRKLKSWLLVTAGHCVVWEFEADAISPPVLRALRQAMRDTFWQRTEGKLRMYQPQPISFRMLKSDEFQPVKNKVFETITTLIVPGTTIEEIMDMVRAQWLGRSPKEATSVYG